MGNVCLGSWIFTIEVAAIGEDLGGWNFPCAFILLSFTPPGDQRREFLKLDRSRLGVILSPLGKWLLVIPDITCRGRSVKEENISRDAGVGCEDSIR